MNRRTVALLTGLVLLVSAALLQRVAWNYDDVFVDDDVLFRGTDSWYHARLIEHEAVAREPMLQHDPYLKVPAGGMVRVAPLFDEIGGLVARLALGLRNADPASTEDMLLVRRVAAWLPAVLGALIVLPVFFMARRLWGVAAGWTAALGFLAVPGQLLSRSLLGATDHHVAEVLFSTSVLAFLVGALSEPEGTRSRRGTAFAVCAGLCLAAYQLSWVAGLMLPLMLSVWVVSAALIERWLPGPTRRHGPSKTTTTALTASLISMGLVLLGTDGVRVPLSSTAFNAVLVVSAMLVWFVQARGPSLGLPRWVPWVVLGAGLSIGAVSILGPFPVWSTVKQYLFFLRPRPVSATVREATPLLQTGPGFSALWRELGMSWLIAIPGLAMIAARALRGRSSANLLVLGWSLMVLLLTFSQVRFGYYLGVVSVLAASALVGFLVSNIRGSAEDALSPAKTWSSVLAATGIVLLFVGPNLRATRQRMKTPASMKPAWVETLDWLRTETPDPFGDRDCYFAWTKQPLPPGANKNTERCIPDYGIFAWWDYGYWIIERARRVPFANPSQAGARAVSAQMLSTDPASVVADLSAEAEHYVVIDALLSILQPGPRTPVGKFPAMAIWARADPSRFFETVLFSDPNGNTRPAMLFYEDYFRTFVVRMVINGGQELVPARIPIVELESRPQGPRLVRSLRFFDDYIEAQEFVGEASIDSANDWRIASLEALQPPLHLPAIGGIQEVFASSALVARSGQNTVPAVRVLKVEAIPKTPLSR